MIDPKEETKESITYVSSINVLIGLCVACIGYIVYIIINTNTIDDVKENIIKWIKRVLHNSHISNGTFYINQFQI